MTNAVNRYLFKLHQTHLERNKVVTDCTGCVNFNLVLISRDGEQPVLGGPRQGGGGVLILELRLQLDSATWVFCGIIVYPNL